MLLVHRRVAGTDLIAVGSVQSQVTFDAFEALTEFVDLGLEGPGLFELAACTRGGEGLVDHDCEGNDSLGAVHAGDHLGGDSPAAIPRAQGGARHAGGLYRFFEGDPAFFDGVAGQVAEKAVPTVPGIGFVVVGHRGITTVATPA